MSSFDGIFPHCLGIMITFLSRTKGWLLHDIILINPSYQAAPGSILPAHILIRALQKPSLFQIRIPDVVRVTKVAVFNRKRAGNQVGCWSRASFPSASVGSFEMKVVKQ